MKFILKLTIIIIVFYTPYVWGKTVEQSKQNTENCNRQVDVKVNGLVCDFCARALEKVFGKQEEVSGIAVDLDNGKVVVTLKEGQKIDNVTLTALITDSGYNVVDIQQGCYS
ncbi:MAG: heavy metal-associated domain-containing protein [Pseudomonadota bacterium]